MFLCNICGANNAHEVAASEPASCACGSNVRLRALVHLLSWELFGQDLSLPDFPRLKSIRGLGMSDQESYARILADKFSYTNTYYDREPRFDFTASHPEQYGTYDFILSADVIEHIAPPVERALEEACKLLKPHGFLCMTIYCAPGEASKEHFPELFEYRIVPLGKSFVMVNRRRDGTVETYENLVFHSGEGATLEMREFVQADLDRRLVASGFHEAGFLSENRPELGIVFDKDTSQPLVARKRNFVLEKPAIRELVDGYNKMSVDLWEAQQRLELRDGDCSVLDRQIRAVKKSKWVALGNRVGLGPRIP